MTTVVQLNHRKKPHPADDLSFMERRTPEGSGINYWMVDSTGAYEADCKRGMQLAHEYLSYIGQHPTAGNATLLGCIVRGMLERAQDGKIDGVAIGFLRSVNCAAMVTAMYAPEATQKI